jgi:hypothetical protein
MNRWIMAVLVLITSGCVEKNDFSATFSEWQQRLDAKPKTGFPWTKEDMELDRILGAQAHLHELFLRTKLQDNAHVHRILDASQRLCRKYAIPPVTLHENGTYFIVEGRQQLWLNAMSNETSQPVNP